MKDRLTQLLGAVACMLLLAQSFRGAPATTSAQAEEDGRVSAVLRARMIELVDERGQVRASLKTEPEGEVVFRLIDAKGTIRVKLGAAEDGSGLVLLDDRTEPGVHMLAKRAGTVLTLSEKGKEARVIRP